MKVENISIWEYIIEAFYDTFYEELMSEELSGRYETIDTVTSFMVAVTASGSAIAGWSLWNQPNWKPIWAIIAGIVFVLSISHGILGVTSRVKEQEELRREFLQLRLDFEKFRQAVELDHIDEVYPKYVKLQDRYITCKKRAKKDNLIGIGLFNKVNKSIIEEKKKRGDLDE